MERRRLWKRGVIAGTLIVLTGFLAFTFLPRPVPSRLREGAPVRAEIGAAISALSTETITADIRTLAVPRHHRAAPDALRAAASLVHQRFAADGLEVHEVPVSYDGASFPVIVGERDGTAEADAGVVVILAHYDSVADSPGADDDASGVAGLLSIANVLASVKTRATIRCVAVPFEEQGLIGSRAYVQSLTEAERRNIIGVFVLEMIGFVDTAAGSQRYPPGLGALFPGRTFRDRGDFIAAFGERHRSLPLDALEAARPYVPELRVETLSLPWFVARMKDMRRSDHAPFWEVGISAAFIGDTANFRTPHYHRPSDTPETIDATFATRTSKLVAAAAFLLAEPVDAPR